MTLCIHKFLLSFRIFPQNPLKVTRKKINYNPAMTDAPSLYELLGGETGLRALVDRFYDIMDSAEEARTIRALHPADLTNSRDKFFMFLSGWSGGPPLYIQTYGHPRLRMRHMPFPIGSTERDQWLWCMNKALDEGGYQPAVVEHLKGRFAEIADFMKNKQGG